MAWEATTLLVGDHAWQLGLQDKGQVRLESIDLPEQATPQTIAQAMREALAGHGYSGRPLVLAIPSTWCLTAPVAVQDLPRAARPRRKTLLYRFEDALPLAAEQLVADFLPAPARAARLGTDALGVAAALERLEPLVQALEDAGLAIEAITPTALLALAGHDQPQADLVLWGDGQDQLELLGHENGWPTRWQHLPADPRLVMPQLRQQILRRRQPPTVIRHHVPAALAAAMDELQELKLVHEDQASLDEAAVRAARGVLEGRSRAERTANLRRDRLAVADRLRQVRRPLVAALAAAALCLATVSGGLLWQAQQHRQQAQAAQATQREQFHRLYPGQAAPMVVRTHLESELRRLRGLQGMDGQARFAQPRSALHLLHESLRRLPTDLRYRVLDLRLDENELYLAGHARSHGDANRLASALRRQQGFEVEPPRTEQLADGSVSFTLSALLPPDAPPPGQAAGHAAPAAVAAADPRQAGGAP